jgi:hypothetical protein
MSKNLMCHNDVKQMAPLHKKDLEMSRAVVCKTVGIMHESMFYSAV